MSEKLRKIIVPMIIAVLMIGAFPLMVNASEEQEPIGSGRANEVTVNEIEIVAPEEYLKNGIYGNGLYPIAVNFTLAQQIMDVNVTLNVTRGANFEVDVNPMGTLAAGDYEPIANMLFDFKTPGLYTVNATVSGWNGTANVTGYKEVVDINFTTVIEFVVEINIDAMEVGDVYGKNLMVIECTVNNTGNGIVWDTNVSLAIKNVTDDVPEDLLESWEILDPLPPEMKSDKILFFWVPSKEGATSNYEINITAENTTLNQMNSTTLVVQVTNITDINLVSMIVEPPQIYPTGSLLVTVLLNNTGNSAGMEDIQLVIYPDGQPGTLTVDETKSTKIINASQGTSGREYGNEVMFLGLLVNEPGNYTVEARLLGTAQVLTGDLEVLQAANQAPELMNGSFLPEEPITAGTEVTFSVIYKDMDGDEGDVTLYLDDEAFTMLNGSDNWANNVTYTYTWVSTAGLHTFYFFAEDTALANVTLMDGPVEFEINISAPTDGWLYGKVTDDDGNVSGAELVMYSTKLNETNATVIDEYITVDSTDVDGEYSLKRAFSDTNYVIKVDADWMTANNYETVTPNIVNFVIDEDHDIVWANFTLAAGAPPLETLLKGTVNDTAGTNMSDVDIIVEIFVDVAGEINVSVDGDNVTMNTTTRTWMNMTTMTDVNGSFAIKDIPFGIVEIGDLTTTGSKMFKHEDGGAPESAQVGKWNVIARMTGYLDDSKVLDFGEGVTTWWNATIELDLEPKYTISGTVNPANATVKIGTLDVEVNATTGAFLVGDLKNGNYTLTFSRTGYKTVTEIVTINGSDETLTITLPPDGGPVIVDYDITIGPFLDANGDAVAGINVSFTHDGKLWWAITGSDGKAIIKDFPVETLPGTTEIKREYDGEVKSGAYSDIDYEEFTGDIKADPEDEDLWWLWVIIVIVVIAIIIIVVIIVMKSKGDEDEDIFDDVMREELECPGCSEPVFSDMDSCPECGEELEFPEEEEGLEEEEGEMEMEGEAELEDELMEEPGEPEDLDELGIEDDEELEGVEEMAGELEEEELEAPDDLEEELEDLDDDLELEDL